MNTNVGKLLFGDSRKNRPPVLLAVIGSLSALRRGERFLARLLLRSPGSRLVTGPPAAGL